jgi:hypothetical protein
VHGITTTPRYTPSDAATAQTIGVIEVKDLGVSSRIARLGATAGSRGAEKPPGRSHDRARLAHPLLQAAQPISGLRRCRPIGHPLARVRPV